MFFSEKFEQAPRDNGRQRSLASCSPWGHRVRQNSATVQHQKLYTLYEHFM